MQEHDLPLALTVKDVAKVLRIGMNKSYELVRSPGFPCLRLGNRIVVPRDALIRWMEESSSNRGQAR